MKQHCPAKPLVSVLCQGACCCSVAESSLTLCNLMDCSTPGFLVLHHLLEFAQTYVYWVGDAIQSSHPLSPSSPPALNLSQNQGLFKWVGSSHQVARVLELQLQHLSFQWIFRVGFLQDWLVWYQFPIPQPPPYHQAFTYLENFQTSKYKQQEN